MRPTADEWDFMELKNSVLPSKQFSKEIEYTVEE